MRSWEQELVAASLMIALGMIIFNAPTQEAVQVGFTQRYDMVQQLTADGAHASLAKTIVPWARWSGSFGLDTEVRNGGLDSPSELRISVHAPVSRP